MSRQIFFRQFVLNHNRGQIHIHINCNNLRGGRILKQCSDSNEERCVILGKYIIENNATVRAAAREFGISKSTVHQDITAKLEKTDKALYDEVKNVLDRNKQERHIRGGEATKRKYQELSKKRFSNT
ncbi:MAG: hypothetical protein HDT42_05155 [Ruminococcaceae bacterium]|nr:hypothetical protein [Oscillospiraceae bacterium]